MQPSSKCALSKACCCSWGNLREGLVLSCRRRPPSLIIPTTPHLSSRACTPIPSVAACLAACVAGLVRDLGSHQGPALRGRQGDEAERSEDPVRLKSLAGSLIRCPSDQTRPAQYAYGNAMDPLFEFWIDSLPISRISHAAPDHNLLPSQDAQSTIYYIIVYQPRGAQTDILICTCSTCPRHLALSLVLQYPQSKLGEVSQSVSLPTQSIAQSACMCTVRSPTVCSRWFDMSDENRLVLDCVAQASNAIPPATHSPIQNQQDRDLAQWISQFNKSGLRLLYAMHDAYTRY